MVAVADHYRSSNCLATIQEQGPNRNSSQYTVAADPICLLADGGLAFAADVISRYYLGWRTEHSQQVGFDVLEPSIA